MIVSRDEIVDYPYFPFTDRFNFEPGGMSFDQRHIAGLRHEDDFGRQNACQRRHIASGEKCRYAEIEKVLNVSPPPDRQQYLNAGQRPSAFDVFQYFFPSLNPQLKQIVRR